MWGSLRADGQVDPAHLLRRSGDGKTRKTADACSAHCGLAYAPRGGSPLNPPGLSSHFTDEETEPADS